MKTLPSTLYSGILLAIVLAVTGGVYTTAIADDITIDPDAMVAAHNTWRSEAGVPDIKWSADLANTAQAWANTLKGKQCALQHNSGSGYGENLYWASAHQSATSKDAAGNWIWENTVQAITEKDAVDSWGIEKQWYDYNSNSCNAPTGKACGHYTQVVWKASTEVGCGIAACDDKSQVWVCNYNHPGNIIGQKPY